MIEIDRPQTVRHRIFSALLILSIVAIVFISYGDMLGYYFTGSDSLALIGSSRIYSPGDIVHIFTQPLASGTGFERTKVFYRPIASLSYGIDYFLSGLNPFGYHLTDLLLQMLVSVSLFFLIRIMTSGRTLVAWLGAVIFTLHPILAENVPCIARRHDMLASLFIILSAIFLLEHISDRRSSDPPERKNSHSFLILSLAAYVCALGSKEAAFLFPGAIAAYAVIFGVPARGVSRDQVVRFAFIWVPYLVISAIFFIWRMHILGGMGGYVRKDPGLFGSSTDIAGQYFIALFQPVPLESGGIVLGFALTVFIIGFIGLCRVVGSDNAENRRTRHTGFGMLLFLCMCLILPLSLFLLTHTFSLRSIYFSVIPLSIILSLGLSESADVLFRSGGGKRVFAGRFRLLFAVPSFVVAMLMCGYFAYYSPALNSYGEWRASGRVSKMFLQEFSKLVTDMPADADIFITNMPKYIDSYRSHKPHAQSVSYLANYSILAWLQMNYPGNRMRIIIKRPRKVLPRDPSGLHSEITIYSNKKGATFDNIYEYDE